jgi:ribosomal protein S27E
MVTTLSLSEAAKSDLEQYRHPSHDSWSDTVEAIVDVLPDESAFREAGCVYCGEPLTTDDPIEERTFVVSRVATEEYIDGDPIDVRFTNYFCSPECCKNQRERVNSLFPEHPDRVLVGGETLPQAAIENASFYYDGEDTMEVVLDVPGAFAGESEHGLEYDYTGEPIYVENDGRWVHSGVVNDVIHEDGVTVLDVGHDHATERLNHPDDDVREEYEDKHAEWFTIECPDCGEESRSYEGAGSGRCPECGLVMEDVEEHRVEADQ